jgi:molecular chaperone HtpG
VVDAPVQLFALLFIPSSTDKLFFSPRHEDGLKLYARNVLIQDFCKDLLPEYMRFIQGVVDSEDLPLNVSRETIQSSRTIAQLKKLITNKVLDLMKDLATSKEDEYKKFWDQFGGYIKEGIATDMDFKTNLSQLLRVNTLFHPEELISLDLYLQNKKSEQNKIYYLTGPDRQSLLNSPHLDLFRYHEYDVMILSDPIDSFMILNLTEYNNFALSNAASETLPEKPQEPEKEDEVSKPLSAADREEIIRRFKACLGNKIVDVKSSTQMINSPARLVVPSGAPSPELEKVYRIMGKDVKESPRVLEINPNHLIIKKLGSIDVKHPLNSLIIEQVFENALLYEGLHPNPANMVQRIQSLIEAALPD